jgi:hypothetical protein
MTILSSNGLSFPKRIGNKTAFQQARILLRQAFTRAMLTQKRSRTHKTSAPKKIRYVEWSVFNFSIDKALSNLTCRINSDTG